MCWGSLVPRPSAQLSLTCNVGEGLVFLSQVSDVMMERMIERVLVLCVGERGSEQHEELRSQVTYHTHLASGGQALSM